MFNSYFFSKSVCGCWPWSSEISADHCWMGFNNNWRIHCKCFATGKSVITVHLLVTDHDWIHEGLYTLYWGSLEFKNIWFVVQYYLQFKIMWSLEWLNMMLVFYISSDICGFSPFSGPQLSWITNSNTTNINGWMLPNVRGIMLQKRWKGLIFLIKVNAEKNEVHYHSSSGSSPHCCQRRLQDWLCSRHEVDHHRESGLRRNRNRRYMRWRLRRPDALWSG